MKSMAIVVRDDSCDRILTPPPLACMNDLQATSSLDTSGKCCPMPMVETNEAIKSLASGDILEIITTHPGTREDNKVYRYYVSKN